MCAAVDAKQAKDRSSIQDDENGHLIYKEGDVLQARCTQTCFVISTSTISSTSSLSVSFVASEPAVVTFLAAALVWRYGRFLCVAYVTQSGARWLLCQPSGQDCIAATF